MQYKYIFEIEAYDMEDPINSAAKSLKDFFNIDLMKQAVVKFKQTISVNLLLNKEQVELLRKEIEQELSKIFLEKKIEILSVTFLSCEVEID